ncbi:hypothetical protein Chor_008635 [Crotalus horridus]
MYPSSEWRTRVREQRAREETKAASSGGASSSNEEAQVLEDRARWDPFGKISTTTTTIIIPLAYLLEFLPPPNNLSSFLLSYISSRKEHEARNVFLRARSCQGILAEKIDHA